RARVSRATICERLSRGVDPEVAIAGAPGTVELGPSAPRAARNQHSIDWDLVHRLYVRDGLSVAEIVGRIHASERGLRSGLRARGWLREHTCIHEREYGPAIYKVWSTMRQRCFSPIHVDFPAVGAKGI